MAKSKPEPVKKVLAIGAHPDDLEFTCLIALKNLIAEGYEVTFLIITNGENGFKIPGYTKEKRIKTRRKEQLDAAKILGVKKVLFWNYKDSFLRYTENLRKKLILLIRHIKPEIIFSFDPGNPTFENLNLFHRDHRIAAVAVFDACFAAKNEYIYGKMAKPHRVSKIFFYGASQPNHFVDITKDIDFKLSVLACHKSQFPDFNEFSNYFKENLANYSPDYKYSEAFRVIEVRKIT